MRMKSCCYFWENSRKYKKITIKRMLARTFGGFFRPTPATRKALLKSFFWLCSISIELLQENFLHRLSLPSVTWGIRVSFHQPSPWIALLLLLCQICIGLSFLFWIFGQSAKCTADSLLLSLRQQKVSESYMYHDCNAVILQLDKFTSGISLVESLVQYYWIQVPL